MYAVNHDRLYQEGYERYLSVPVSAEDAAVAKLNGKKFVLEDVVVPIRSTLREFPIAGMKIIYVMRNGQD
jgi:hypothetical protein